MLLYVVLYEVAFMPSSPDNGLVHHPQVSSVSVARLVFTRAHTSYCRRRRRQQGWDALLGPLCQLALPEMTTGLTATVPPTSSAPVAPHERFRCAALHSDICGLDQDWNRICYARSRLESTINPVQQLEVAKKLPLLHPALGPDCPAFRVM